MAIGSCLGCALIASPAEPFAAGILYKQARACLLLFAEVKRSFWEMLRGCVVVHHQLLVCSDLFHRIVYMWHELLSFGDFIRFILGSFSICS